MLDDAVTRWRLSGPFGCRHVIAIAVRGMYSDIVRYLSAAIIAELPHPRSISRYRLIDKNPSFHDSGRFGFSGYTCEHMQWLNDFSWPVCVMHS